MSKRVRRATPAVPDAAPAGSARVRALLVLLAQRRARFLAFVTRHVRSSADAEDLLQQALVRAAEGLRALRDDDRLEAWFYKVLRSTIADHHAASGTLAAKLELLRMESDGLSSEPGSICGCSLAILGHLRPPYAAVIRRVDIEGEPLAAAAASLGISVGNAKVRLHRARTALREELRRRCGTDSVRTCQGCSCS